MFTSKHDDDVVVVVFIYGLKGAVYFSTVGYGVPTLGGT